MVEFFRQLEQGGLPLIPHLVNYGRYGPGEPSIPPPEFLYRLLYDPDSHGFHTTIKPKETKDVPYRPQQFSFTKNKRNLTAKSKKFSGIKPTFFFSFSTFLTSR
jgi:hypothetical protein